MSDIERALAVMKELEADLRKLGARPMTLDEVRKLTTACSRAELQIKQIIAR